MLGEAETIEMSDIDAEDNTYRITTQIPVDDLAASISDTGIINPPILKHKDSKYTIVSGFRRIEACRKLMLKYVKCRVLGPDTDETQCVKIAISENSFQRPLNLIEQSRSLNMLSFFFDNEDLLREASALTLPGNLSVINRIKTLSRLSRKIQEGILDGFISFPVALELQKLPEKASTGIADLFCELKTGINKQKEILNFIIEIAAREGISVSGVLEGSDMSEIMNSDDSDRNQKTGKIRYYLKQRRYPTITAAEAEFLKNLKHLELDNHTRLIPPKDFEGMTYSLNMKFNNIDELRDRNELLKVILENPALKRILE